MVGSFHPQHTVGNYISLSSSFAIHSFHSPLRSSLAHGIPPHISKDQFDVPMPTVQNLLSTGQESEKRTRAAESFIPLCSLTQILGDILPLIYDLELDYKDAGRKSEGLNALLTIGKQVFQSIFVCISAMALFWSQDLTACGKRPEALLLPYCASLEVDI